MINIKFANTFKALSDKTRRDILDLLKEGEMSAGDISRKFNISAATISHHLSVLKEAGLVRDKKDGKYIYYQLNLSVFEEIMKWTRDFIKEEKNEKQI